MAVDIPSTTQVVVLVRHGDAIDKAIDPARPLSPDGRRRAANSACCLDALELPIAEVRHSGKLRAEQTAEIFAEHLGVTSEQIRRVDGIAPNDDVEPVAIELEAERKSVLLAGHLPFMGRLASRLLSGDRDRLVTRFADAAALVLANDHGKWALVALITPELGQT